MMAIDNCDWHFSYGLVRPFEVDPNGDVHAPEGPGIGAEIDWDLVNSSVTAASSQAQAP
jgi:L-alanine-DL-glutamate epimerase-like enolase superfamily enzyme